MTDSSKAISSAQEEPARRCPACGESIVRLERGRCVLCGFQIEELDVTSEDHTPYAEALSADQPGWWTMCKWVYGAGAQRLTHLGLMRSSTASRRFARVNVLLLTATVFLAVFANTGWHVVHRGPRIDAATESPTGRAWLQVAARPGPLPEQADRLIAVGLWWNVPLAALTAAIAVVVTLLTSFVLLWLVGRGSRRALQGAHGRTPRLQCAIQYSTAGVNLLVLAGMALVPRPVTAIGLVRDWALVPSPAVFHILFALLGLVGLAGWWFWLIRLGETVPKETRRTVSRCFVVWVPLWVVVLGGGGAAAVYILMHRLGSVTNLAW